VDTVHDLGECRYGAWTGGALKDLAQDPLWRVVQDHPSAARFPDSEEFPGESIAEMQLRAVRAIRATDAAVARDHGPDALWVAVSHGDVIKSVIADAAGAHLDQFQRIMVDPASLSVVRYTERRPFVVRVNDAGIDLAGLVPPPPKPAATDEAGEAESGDAEPGHAGGGHAEADMAAGAVPALDTSGDAPVGGGAGTAD
jgi:broad specificity phosphatase PhoE